MQRTTLFVVLLIGGCSLATFAAQAASKHTDQKTKRAKPPVWTRDVLDAFFTDARDHLVGVRPSPAEQQGAQLAGNTPDSEASGNEADKFAWSQLVDADTLTTEIKRTANILKGPLISPGKFKGGGFQHCRLHFSRLAVLLAIVADHDQPVRWQKQAASLAAGFAKSARNCKVATDQSYQEATNRHVELQSLLRGERFESAAKPVELWSELADRPVLMKWMEDSQKQRLAPPLATERAFKRDVSTVLHEAQLLAVLAEMIQRQEFDYWDDDAYLDHAKALRAASSALSEAADLEDYQQARAAAGKVSQSCSNCHEEYRG